jgi:ABC-type branched-subunit amino acid transport system ATPase component
MITRFRVQNYKALRDVTLDLTPVHVLIGPNDSGKTSLLEAVAALSRSVDHPPSQYFKGDTANFVLCHNGVGTPGVFEVKWTDAIQCLDGKRIVGYSLTTGLDCWTESGVPDPYPNNEKFLLEDGLTEDFPSHQTTTLIYAIIRGRFECGNPSDRGIPKEIIQQVAHRLQGTQFYRFSPDWLKVPVTLSPQRQGRMEFNGFGLPQLLDEIRNDRERFAKLESRFTRFFPYIMAIELPVREAFEASAVDYRRVKPAEYTGGKGIEFRLDKGRKLSAENASDGVMFVLAYLALLHLPNPPRFLLIEEPENGIHPARLKEIIRILKQLVSEQSHTQVLMTTHSPYVVHEFEPHEVTLCTRGADEAVQTRRLSESKTVREQIDFFSLGEIWTQDGDEALMQPAEVVAPAASEEAAGT